MTDMIDGKNWMFNAKRKLSHRSFTTTPLLGTHDSATAAISRKAKFGPDALVKVGKWRHLPASHWITACWGRSQPLTIYEQLTEGVRYLDLRVCRVGKDDFYTAHALLSTPLDQVFEQIRAFHRNHTEEIILLDFNHFYHMTLEQHEQFVEKILTYFSPLLLPKTFEPTATFGQIWKTPHRIIVFYDHPEMCHRFNGLWPQTRIRSSWPKATKTASLEWFLLEDLLGRDKTNFFVSQCILTPTVWMITRGILSLGIYPASIRRTGEAVNRRILASLKALTPDERSLLNIVLVDWCTREVAQRYLEILLRSC